MSKYTPGLLAIKDYFNLEMGECVKDDLTEEDITELSQLCADTLNKIHAVNIIRMKHSPRKRVNPGHMTIDK